MIPSVVAEQLKRGLADYIETTFPFANEPFRSSFPEYLNKDKNLCQEPYTAIRLPFRSCTAMPTCFEAVVPAYLPYVHQQKAFDRLTGDDGRSTLVATGTGSGKTECFLYPVIDYCYRHRHERGVKAIIIYPMNALASDQAGRMAKLIYHNDKLRDNVTVGLYVGGLTWSEGVKVMGRDSVITDRETMIENPPDILLTNYKMLDYLLMRPHDSRIWKNNHPDTLKYIVVDELHTFDGAQGTDLACLLRRLKNKLFIQQGYLCCVGTSATMGSDDSESGIIQYAHDLFGEPFDNSSVIQESRQTIDEFFDGQEPMWYSLPDDDQAKNLQSYLLENDFDGYMNLAYQAFFDTNDVDLRKGDARITLGSMLKSHALFQSLMKYSKGGYYRASEAVEALRTRHPMLTEDSGTVVLDALAALVSQARADGPTKLMPFLNVQVQLWGKELRRLVASVGSEHIEFDIDINLPAERQRSFLPVLNCRDCGQTAWAGLTTQDRHVRARNLNAFYNTFFGSGENLVAVYPHASGAEGAFDCWYCPGCGCFVELDDDTSEGRKNCPECDAEMIQADIVELKRITKAGTSRSHAKQYRCPCCGSDQGLAIMGLRGTTESEVLLTQLFASSFDEDVRTLVFSDNVQDASHRAGFFNGRTWKFGLRAAMQEYLRNTETRQSVARFQTCFADYWLDQLPADEFVARFIAPNNTWMREYEHLLEKGKLTGTGHTRRLIETIKSRIAYEALLELGMRSHIGRTMEKSAAIAVEFDAELIDKAAGILSYLMENDRGIQIEPRLLKLIIQGILQLLRAHGAYADPIYLDFIRGGANAYLLNHKKLIYMPSLRASGVPRFPLASGLSRKGFSNWMSPEFISVVQRTAPDLCGCDADMASALVRNTLRACNEAGLLSKLEEESRYCCYGINETKVYVTTHAVRMECDTCGRTVVRARGNLGQLLGAPCFFSSCPGHLHEANEQGLDYYGNLFSGGLRDRILAHEHTGLLERKDREEVEREFKASDDERRPWYPNVLSCTPTLEMGIDIGDLSSLIMCGMPPGQAQFLQRAGRAGRRDGNALSVVVTDASPHGMYFYTQPSEMLEGNVEPPRVFLEASAVLERQFTAYCLDKWTKDVNDDNCVPRTMFKPLQNMASPEPDSAKFPLNLLDYVKSHTNQLINSFLQMFAEDFSVNSEVAQSLKSFVAGGADASESRLHVRLFDAFYSRMNLRSFYQNQKAVIDEVIEELKSHPQDSSYDKMIKDHEVERRAIDGVIKSINNENVFGFMSREGLLPNYAFPEEGANLRVVLRRRPEDLDQDDSKWERETREYSRAAASAISEFAPGNTFYANGRHYLVDQVDLSSAKEEEWRLCPDCSHAELITPSTPSAACPKCHSTGWADKAQRRKMLKLSTVISNADYSESMSDDSSDKRDITFFARQLLVEVAHEDVVRAYKIKGADTDFGFEYAKRATLREINYGPEDAGMAQESSIAGEVCVRKGFKVCKKCGKVQWDDEKQNHSYFCDVKRGKLSHEDAIEECLFLYREFETEAIRMLIPETSAIDITEGIVESFKASVMLGLKRKFGNVDHLAMTVSEEPVPESGYKKRYLVVYDSVPGGTGYLKQLVSDGEEFMSVLRLAYDAMAECPQCKDDPDRDGCYRCLYAYRQSNAMGSISRKQAMEVLSSILAAGGIEDVPCLDDVDVSNLFDSALEKMFVDALSGVAGPDGGSSKCLREVVNGKPGYRLTLGDFIWEVEPQVDLGPSQGVAVACRPDFVFWPIAKAADDARRPVAVFTDGFEYHKDRLADDIVKRESICRSGRFRVWSLSYQDVERALKGSYNDHYLDILRVPELPTEAMYNQLIAGKSCGFDPAKESPFSSLMWYLGHKNGEEAFAVHAEAYSLGMTKVSLAGSRDYSDSVEQSMSLAQIMQIDLHEDATELAFAGSWRPGEHVCILGACSKEDVRQRHGTLLIALLDDSDTNDIAFQRQWNGCLDLYNLMQFFWGFVLIAKSGIEEGAYARLDTKIPFVFDGNEESESANSIRDDAWDGKIEEMLGIGEKFALSLKDWGIPAPDEVGYELDSGEQADLVWIDRRICFLTQELLEDRAAFERDGWRVINETQGESEVRAMFGAE